MIIVLRNLIFLFSFICLGSCQSNSKNGHRLIGGWIPKDIDHESVKDNAKYAINVLNDRSNDMYFENLIHIHDAKAQLVSGVKYNITFDMSRTICRKNEIDSNKPEQCVPDQSSTIKRCDVTIWDRPWLNKKVLLHSDCKGYLSYPEYFSDAHTAKEREFQLNRKINLM